MEKQTNWMRVGNIQGETESLIVAAKDTKNDSKCQICKIYDESLEHITSWYPIIGEGEYRERHNKVCLFTAVPTLWLPINNRYLI